MNKLGELKKHNKYNKRIHDCVDEGVPVHKTMLLVYFAFVNVIVYVGLLPLKKRLKIKG